MLRDDGIEVAQTLHRIELGLVQDELTEGLSAHPKTDQTRFDCLPRSPVLRADDPVERDRVHQRRRRHRECVVDRPQRQTCDQVPVQRLAFRLSPRLRHHSRGSGSPEPVAQDRRHHRLGRQLDLEHQLPRLGREPRPPGASHPHRILDAREHTLHAHRERFKVPLPERTLHPQTVIVQTSRTLTKHRPQLLDPRHNLSRAHAGLPPQALNTLLFGTPFGSRLHPLLSTVLLLSLPCARRLAFLQVPHDLLGPT
ncbi:hypothetical protein [Streptomyces sp. NPDC001340]